MINVEFRYELDEELGKLVNTEFNKYAEKNGVVCNYKLFVFIAKEGEENVGLITGNSYYEEVHIADLIVLEEHRGKDIGTKLVREVEEYHKNKGFKNINLTTYGFQALGFYQKCGYEVEFVRENEENPKLNKYFLVKKL